MQGRRTHYLYQPAVGAFYSGAPYSSKELISARDPWSGYYAPDVGIYTTMQFTQFAADNWMYIPDASSAVIGNRGNSEMDGNAPGAEYNRLVFVSPDKKDFSVVMVNDSDREADYLFNVKKNIASAGNPLQVWETRGPDAGEEYDANRQRGRLYLHADRQTPLDGQHHKCGQQSEYRPSPHSVQAEPRHSAAVGAGRGKQQRSRPSVRGRFRVQQLPDR
jgi:hypothetical protein